MFVKVLSDFVADLAAHVHECTLTLAHSILRSLKVSRVPEQVFQDEVIYLQTQLCRQVEEARGLGVGRVVEALQDRVFSRRHGGRGVEDNVSRKAVDGGDG